MKVLEAFCKRMLPTSIIFKNIIHMVNSSGASREMLHNDDSTLLKAQFEATYKTRRRSTGSLTPNSSQIQPY